MPRKNMEDRQADRYISCDPLRKINEQECHRIFSERNRLMCGDI
jgi:hypothetical protein